MRSGEANKCHRAYSFSMPRAPDLPARSAPEGTISTGYDGQQWVAVADRKGVNRWILHASARLNGLKALSLDYLAEHVGEPIRIYDSSWDSMWPSGPADRELESYLFVPDGNAVPAGRKTVWKNWLLTRRPQAPRQGNLMITGYRPEFRDNQGPYLGMMGGYPVISTEPVDMQSFVED